MRQREIDSYLQHKVPRISLLYGENNFLIRRYSSVIQSKIGSSPRTVYFNEYDEDMVVSMLEMDDLFERENLVVAKVGTTLKRDHAKKVCEALQKNPGSFFVAEMYKNENESDWEYSSKCKEISSYFCSKNLEICSVRFFPSTLEEISGILREIESALDVSLDSDAEYALFEMQDGNMDLIEKEIERLSVYRHITHDVVMKNCSPVKIKIQKLVDALFEEDKDVANTENALTNEGVKAMEISYAINRYFLNLFKISAHFNEFGRIDVRESIGFRPPREIAIEYEERGKRINAGQYTRIFVILNELRTKIVEGKEEALGTCLAKLKAIIMI